MMKTFRFVLVHTLFILLLCTISSAEIFVVDRTHSSVGFSIRHLLSRVHGRFTDFSGTIRYDEKKPEETIIDFEIKAMSIATDNDDRDKHLRGADFFNVDTFQTMTFKSSNVTQNEKGISVTGSLTIHGVTKTVTIPIEVLGVQKSAERSIAGFASEFTIDRKEFGIIWNRPLDWGGTLLSDDVKIFVEIESKTPKK